MKRSRLATTAWEERATRMQDEWKTVLHREDAGAVTEAARWRERLESMRQEQARLKAAGAWTTGPATLMGALWLQNSEVVLTRALAWLLRPDGRHGLGSASLDGLAAHLGLVAPGSDARVVTEESRELTGSDGSPALTRADLVVYAREWTLVVEAKVFAPEQPDQLDRLHSLWADEVNPCFVYLTRGERTPLTARTSAGCWRGMSWWHVAGVLRTATEGRSVNPGVQDFVHTLEAYHRA